MPRKTVKRNGKKTKRVSFRLKSSRRKNVKRNTYKNKRSKNMKRMTGGRIITNGSYTFEKIGGKNILLIIDPQNDFSDAKEGDRDTGNLSVIGATEDYRKIIDFIKNNNASLDEIHVSLDTHTDRHIGHPGFWSRVAENGTLLTDSDGNLLKTDDKDGLRTLKYVKDNVYEGKSMVMFLPEMFHGDEEIRYYTPRNYNNDKYDELCNYVKEYINFYYSENNKHGQVPWIWRTHCIEDSEGHKIAKELQDCLILPDVKNKVRYHIKGQNNLAEMYSIFSAEMPVSQDIMNILKDAVYTGKFNNTREFPVTGVSSYDETKTYVNLDTERNTKLMDHLLGFERNRIGEIINDNMNRIFVCGEAKTHCVKSSLIDLMEYAGNGVAGDRIVLLANMTSPIGPKNFPSDNIVRIAGLENDIREQKLTDKELKSLSMDEINKEKRFRFTVYDPEDLGAIPTVNK